MLGKYEQNSLYEFYILLKKNITMLVNNSYKEHYTKFTENDLPKLILQNNGCGFMNDACYNVMTIMDCSFRLFFIIGGTGNKANIYFDFIDIKGMPYFVIFLDPFKDIMNTQNDDQDDIIAKSAIEFMGKSSYYDIILKLVNNFILLISNPSIFTSTFSATSIAGIYRYAPHIIAASIINDICGELNENDVGGVDYEFIKDIIDNNKITLALYGVFKIN